MEGNNLKQRLKEIDVFFQNISIDEFEKAAFDCGLGTIKSSDKSDYVLASNIRYKDEMRNINNTKDNRFYLSENDNLKGAA